MIENAILCPQPFAKIPIYPSHYAKLEGKNTYSVAVKDCAKKLCKESTQALEKALLISLTAERINVWPVCELSIRKCCY